MTKKLLGRDAILAADDLPFEDVKVPEWGGTVRVRAITAGERDLFEQSVIADRENMGFRAIRARMASLSIVDAKGDRLFTEEDIEALDGKSAAAMDRVFEVSERLSGLGGDDVKELEKNSGAGQRGDSSSS